MRKNRRPDQGIALILVIFVISLASILVVNLAYSTYIGARINSSVERSLQAEYLLKSALNLARTLIMVDTTAEDSPNDPWAIFRNGMTIPPEMIGLTEPNLRVQLEIRPEGSKIPLKMLNPPGNDISRKWREVLARLMENELGFDKDEEEDQTGYFPGRVFKSKELVANIIDYQSDSRESFENGDFKGIKSDLPEGTFPGTTIMRIAELATIPGFTPLRIQKLSPLVTASFASTTAKVNINSAPPQIIRSLDPGIDDRAIEQINAVRNDAEKGPFKDGDLRNQLEPILDSSIIDSIWSMITASSSQFQIVAKVDYGTSTYFLRAYVDRQSGSQGILPQVKSVELF